MSQQFLFLAVFDWKAGIWIFQGVRKLNGAKRCTFLPKENVVVMHLNFLGGECPSGVIVLGGYCPRGLLSWRVNVRGENVRVVIVPIPSTRPKIPKFSRCCASGPLGGLQRPQIPQLFSDGTSCRRPRPLRGIHEGT